MLSMMPAFCSSGSLSLLLDDASLEEDLERFRPGVLALMVITRQISSVE
jgi:hypothetical protein